MPLSKSALGRFGRRVKKAFSENQNINENFILKMAEETAKDVREPGESWPTTFDGLEFIKQNILDDPGYWDVLPVSKGQRKKFMNELNYLISLGEGGIQNKMREL